MSARRLVGLFLLLVAATGCSDRREAPTPKLVRVPNVVGLQESAAVGVLANAGLCLREIDGTERSRLSVVQLASKPYRVVSRSLQPGRLVREHHEIALVAVRPGGADETDTYGGCPQAVVWVHMGPVKLVTKPRGG